MAFIQLLSIGFRTYRRVFFLQDYRSRYALQILVYSEQSPGAFVYQRLDGLSLVEADFEQQMAAREQETRRVHEQPANDAQAVRARRKSRERLVLSDLAL
jgi:hypothetical protein